MTCIGGGVASLGTETLDCGSAITTGPGIGSSWTPTGYNYYCKANCMAGAVKLDQYSQLKNSFSSYICSKNPQGGNVEGFSSSRYSIYGTQSGSNCKCSTLISKLQQHGKHSVAAALSSASNVACGSNALEVEQAEALETYADALEALAEEE
eukprot:gene8680-627_t